MNKPKPRVSGAFQYPTSTPPTPLDSARLCWNPGTNGAKLGQATGCTNLRRATANDPGNVPPYSRFIADLLDRLVSAVKSGDKAQEDAAFRQVLIAVVLLVEQTGHALIEQLPTASKAAEHARAEVAREAVLKHLDPTGHDPGVRAAEAFVRERYERIQREESGEEPAV